MRDKMDIAAVKYIIGNVMKHGCESIQEAKQTPKDFGYPDDWEKPFLAK